MMKERYIHLALTLIVTAGGVTFDCSYSSAIPGVIEGGVGKALPVAQEKTGEGDASKEIATRIRGMNPQEQAEYLLNAKAGGENSAEINFFLGVAMYSAGDVDSAAACFREAIAMDSTYSRAYVNLGIVLDSQRKSFEAEEMYKRALEIDPEDVLAHCHLGYLYQTRGRQSDAIDHYLKAIAVDPQSAQAHYNLGLAFANARIFEEALREWELVIQLDPDGELGKTASENVQLIKRYMEVETP